jgi:DNA-binding response OmpR family regulator
LEILKQDSIMLMFLDLNLPGMSGIDFCKQIRKENWIGVVNAITGYTDLYGLLECRRAGFDDFFEKPVNLEILLKAAKQAFEKMERWNIDQYDLL